MSAEQNKATVSRFYKEVWNKGDVDFAYEVFAEDYTPMTSVRPGLCQVPKDNARSQPTSGQLFPTWNGRWI